MPPSVVFTEVFDFTTVYPADSTEWCPVEGRRDVFTVATYRLLEDGEGRGRDSDCQKRVGSVYLFRLDAGRGARLLQRVQCAGVLDCKWAHVPIKGRILLAVATAEGSVTLNELAENEGGDLELRQMVEHHLSTKTDNEATLALSLDWSTGKYSNDVTLAVSDSRGHVTLLSVHEGCGLSEKTVVKSHDFEAWIVAFDYWDPNIFMTGGDDCKINVFDLRTPAETPVLTNRKSHAAGVTSMHSNALKEFAFVTGSYDESVHLWDTRSLRSPVRSEAVGGGVWRLKWAPGVPDTVLAACMYGGFAVVSDLTSAKGGDPCVVTGYTGRHTNIGYGADWSHLSLREIQEAVPTHLANFHGEARLATLCSFYDRQVSLLVIDITQ